MSYFDENILDDIIAMRCDIDGRKRQKYKHNTENEEFEFLKTLPCEMTSWEEV